VRNLEDIEKDLEAAREALSHAEGTQAEVYSRIVGYYRSVRNWNKGKREEYGERKTFLLPVEAKTIEAKTRGNHHAREAVAEETVFSSAVPVEAAGVPRSGGEGRLLLFVRPACPACPGAKAAANRLGIPVDMVNADTEAGIEEAVRRRVFSTPTAILLTGDGQELGRAFDAGSIRALAACQ
jgi:ribonucleoside-triphosphate reductase